MNLILKVLGFALLGFCVGSFVYAMLGTLLGIIVTILRWLRIIPRMPFTKQNP